MSLYSDKKLEELYFFGKFTEATDYLLVHYDVEHEPFLFIRNYLLNTEFKKFLELTEKIANSSCSSIDYTMLDYYKCYYLYLKGNYREFFEIYQKVLAFIQRPEAKNQIDVSLLFEIKMIQIQALYKTGKLHLALDELNELEKTQLLSKEDKFFYQIENLHGNVYHELGDVSKAKEYHTRVYEYFLSINNESKLASPLNNLARILQVEGELHKASLYFEKAAELHRKFNHIPNLILSLNNLAILYYNQGKIKESINIGNETLELTKGFNDPFAIGYSYFLLGLDYLALGEYDQADSYFSIGLDNWLKTNNPFLICSCIYYIVKLDVRLNKKIRFDKAPLIYYPRKPFPTRVAKLIYDLIRAEILNSLGKFEKATEILETVLTRPQELELGFQIQAHESIISNYYELYLETNDSNLLNKVLKRISNWEEFCINQHLIPSLCKIHILRAQVFISLLQISVAELELQRCVELAEQNYLPYHKSFAERELNRIHKLAREIKSTNSSEKVNLEKDMFLPYLREIEKLFQKDFDGSFNKY